MMFRALSDNIVCINGDFGEQVTASGIILGDNVHKSQGITSRWFEVFAVGPKIDWIKKHDWVLVEYGRWTPQFLLTDHTLPAGGVPAWKVDPKGCVAVAEQKPPTHYYNTNVITADRKIR